MYQIVKKSEETVTKMSKDVLTSSQRNEGEQLHMI